MKYALICLSLFISSAISANELIIVNSVHQASAKYKAVDLYNYIKSVEPDALLTEGSESMFNDDGSISEDTSGLEVEAYRLLENNGNTPIINVSMENRNEIMREIDYSNTLTKTFQLLQKKFQADELKNPALFNEIMNSFFGRRSCMMDSSLAEINSETCVTAFEKNNDAIFNKMTSLLEQTPSLSSQLNQWKKIVNFHNDRHTALVKNVNEHVCKDTQKTYVLVLGAMHFSEVKRMLSESSCDFSIATYSEA